MDSNEGLLHATGKTAKDIFYDLLELDRHECSIACGIACECPPNDIDTVINLLSDDHIIELVTEPFQLSDDFVHQPENRIWLAEKTIHLMRDQSCQSIEQAITKTASSNMFNAAILTMYAALENTSIFKRTKEKLGKRSILIHIEMAYKSIGSDLLTGIVLTTGLSEPVMEAFNVEQLHRFLSISDNDGDTILIKLVELGDPLVANLIRRLSSNQDQLIKLLSIQDSFNHSAVDYAMDSCNYKCTGVDHDTNCEFNAIGDSIHQLMSLYRLLSNSDVESNTERANLLSFLNRRTSEVWKADRLRSVFGVTPRVALVTAFHR